MRRNALAALILVGIAAVPAVSLAGCGQTSTSSPSSAASGTSGGRGKTGLSVTPSTGSPTTTFSLRFIAPATSAAIHGSRLGYTLGLTAPEGAGCIGSRSVQVPAATKGAPVAIMLVPSRLGGKWCTGTYGARVLELETPVCPAGTMCPQYVRVVATIGTASFRIVRSG